MRLIGHLQNETSARTLGDYLLSIDIRNLVEADGEQWAVWIYSEDQIEAGREALTGYLANPGDSKFQKARQSAAVIEEREKKETEEYQKRIRRSDQIFGRIGPMTMVLMVLSVLVTLLFWVWPLIGQWLFISGFPFGFLMEVRSGEVWRLITPIFVHMNVYHILFNMLMLRDIGSAIESRQSWKRLLALVIVLAIPSNLGQYLYGGPFFGGMSGVIYGLLGYVWLRGRTDPSSGLAVPSTMLIMMLAWFFLCLVNIIPNVANVCHAVGLIVGMIIGAFPVRART